MGLLKVFALFFGLALLFFGVWFLALPILGILVAAQLLKARRLRNGGTEVGSKTRRPLRYVLGCVLLVLSPIAYVSGGIFSPLVFAALGVLVMVWGRLPPPGLGARARPETDSILLRGSLDPTKWTAVAEVKPITRDLGKAVAGLSQTFFVVASETASVYVLVGVRALSRGSAARSAEAVFNQLAHSLAPLGAYLLPLDSVKAFELLGHRLEWTSFRQQDLSAALSTGSYDALCVRSEGGFVKSLSLYKRTQEEAGRGCSVPHPSRSFSHPPLLWEVFRDVGARLSWANPDRYTAFLSSLLASGGEPMGARITDAGEPTSEGMVVVTSQAGPPVKLTRPELRAVLGIYDRRSSGA